jgi:type I restriction enzyme M protein
VELKTLEGWLWRAACAIRGPADASKYKEYILPLVFLKRIGDVFEDEIKRLETEYGSKDLAETLADGDRKLVRFFVPPESKWVFVRSQGARLGQAVTDAMRALVRENQSRLGGVLDVIDFNATTAGQRVMPDTYLLQLFNVLSEHRLGLEDVPADLLGHAYEYLLRKFSEDKGQSSGEFYTPPSVTHLVARLMRAEPGMGVYDPACGSCGIPIAAHLEFNERYGTFQNGRHTLPDSVARLKLYGQEFLSTTYALGRMNTTLHDMDADIRLGDTMQNPRHTNPDGSLMKFGRIGANPMWNQDNIAESIYKTDKFERFKYSDTQPPNGTADWGWVSHMTAMLEANGKAFIVLDTGAVSRGSGKTGKDKERDLRKAFVARDLIEAVILLPENLFYNTSAAGIILVIAKQKAHPGEILLVNASKHVAKGKPKNVIPDAQSLEIAALYHDWLSLEGVSVIVSTADAAKHDFNLSPSRFVSQGVADDVLPLEEAVLRLREAEEERIVADRALNVVLEQLGLGSL